MRLAMKCSPSKEIWTSNNARSIEVALADVHDRSQQALPTKVDGVAVTITPCTATRTNPEKSEKGARQSSHLRFLGSLVGQLLTHTELLRDKKPILVKPFEFSDEIGEHASPGAWCWLAGVRVRPRSA